MKTLKALVTPCPNDTFSLLPWAFGNVKTPISLSLEFSDIESINKLSLQNTEYDLIKCSYSQYNRMNDMYNILPAGSAFTTTIGPLIICREEHIKKTPKQLRIGIPGENTTAYLLLNHYLDPFKEIIVLPYEQMLTSCENGDIDCALIIHELQFMAYKYGFKQYANLFDHWYTSNKLPLPLGGFFLRKETFNTDTINHIIHQSISYSYQHYNNSINRSIPYATVSESKEVIENHIKTYVTDRKSFSSDEINAIKILSHMQKQSNQQHV